MHPSRIQIKILDYHQVKKGGCKFLCYAWGGLCPGTIGVSASPFSFDLNPTAWSTCCYFFLLFWSKLVGCVLSLHAWWRSAACEDCTTFPVSLQPFSWAAHLSPAMTPQSRRRRRQKFLFHKAWSPCTQLYTRSCQQHKHCQALWAGWISRGYPGRLPCMLYSQSDKSSRLLSKYAAQWGAGAAVKTTLHHEEKVPTQDISVLTEDKQAGQEHYTMNQQLDSCKV